MLSPILKDYITRNKSKFDNQIDSKTFEIAIDDKDDFLYLHEDKLSTKCLVRWCLGITQVSARCGFIALCSHM